MSIFEGAATALVTPFTETGIDFKGLQELIDFQLENEIDALVISGTTGEPATMTESEKAEVIRLAIDVYKRQAFAGPAWYLPPDRRRTARGYTEAPRWTGRR